MTIYDHEFKILLLGEDEGSKTTFIKRYCYNSFNPSVRSIIGVDFHVKTVEINNTKIILRIWDFGEEEKNRLILPAYCKGADGAFYLYEIKSQKSLVHLPESIQMIRENAGDIPIMLIGSKLDSNEYRAVSREDGILTAQKYDLAAFCEISAKENVNVDKAFTGMVQLLVERNSQHIIENPNPPELVKIPHKVKNQKKFKRKTMKSLIAEDAKEKNETKEDKSIEEKLSDFGDMVEKIMQIVPELLDNSLLDVNSKVSNLQNQLTAINRDISTLKSRSPGGSIAATPTISSAPESPTRIPPLRILEKLREQFKEFKNVKKCPNCSEAINDYNVKICEKCGAELIKERKTNFEDFMSNFIEDMQLEIEMQQAYIKKLEKELKIKKNRKVFRPPRTASWVDPHIQRDRPLEPLQEDKPRVPRKGNWGYGRKLSPRDGWDGILY